MRLIPFPSKMANQFLLMVLLVSVIIACIVLTMDDSKVNPRYQKSPSLANKDENEDFLCLFTTIKPSQSKMKIYENLLQNCKYLSSHRKKVRCILYDTTLSAINRNDTAEKSSYKGETQRTPIVENFYSRAQIIGWTVANLPRVSPYEGLPYIKDMFRETAKQFPSCTFSAFYNADITFGDGLILTLEAAEKVARLLNDTMLLIGKRTEVSIQGLSGRLFTPPEVDRIAVGKILNAGYFVDFFFIYKHHYPWHAIPNLVIGRNAFDNIIVAKAYDMNVTVIDMTKSAVAVHQTLGDEDNERSNRTHALVNLAIMGPYNYYGGYINHAPYFSEKDKNSTMVKVYHRCGKGCVRLVGDLGANSIAANVG